MYLLKGKLTDKVSHLFADSKTSNSNPPPPSNSNSPPLDHSQARPYSKGGKSLYSFISHIIPSVGFGGFRSNKQQNEVPQNQLLPSGGINEILTRCQDEQLDIFQDCSPACKRKETPTSCEEGEELSIISKNKETLNNHEDNEEPTSGRSTTNSDIFEEASEPQSPEKSVPNLTDDSAFVTPDLYEFLESSLPNIVRGCQWILLYSTLKHGISLRTLIRKSADLSGPCLLIVGDMQGAVFGGLLECPLKPTSKRKYQGTNQSFVFTTIYGAPRLFKPTGANRYFYLCMNDLLALGGGEHFALCLDGELLSGSSGPCDTFGNLCLARTPEFELKNVELWGFTHSSRHLT